MNVYYRSCIEDDKRKLTGLQFIFPGVTLFYIEVSSTTHPPLPSLLLKEP